MQIPSADLGKFVGFSHASGLDSPSFGEAVIRGNER